MCVCVRERGERKIARGGGGRNFNPALKRIRNRRPVYPATQQDKTSSELVGISLQSFFRAQIAEKRFST